MKLLNLFLYRVLMRNQIVKLNYNNNNNNNNNNNSSSV
jgi:hypothetical protein